MGQREKSRLGFRALGWRLATCSPLFLASMTRQGLLALKAHIPRWPISLTVCFFARALPSSVPESKISVPCRSRRAADMPRRSAFLPDGHRRTSSGEQLMPIPIVLAAPVRLESQRPLRDACLFLTEKGFFSGGKEDERWWMLNAFQFQVVE